MERRSWISMAIASGLSLSAGSAWGQKFAAPAPEELLPLLGSPLLLQRIASATTTLADLLAERDASRRPEQRMEQRNITRPRFDAELQLLTRQDAMTQVATRIGTAEGLADARASTTAAIAVAVRMEAALATGGLTPGSQLSIYLLRSFLQVNQYLVLWSPEKRNWYCEIYALRIFCG